MTTITILRCVYCGREPEQHDAPDRPTHKPLYMRDLEEAPRTGRFGRQVAPKPEPVAK